MPRLSAIAGVLAALAIAATASAGVTRHSCVPKSTEVTFRAADGTRLAGYRLGRGTTAVLLAHESRSDSCQWSSYARRLAGLGYLVVAFDFRGHGDSQRRSGKAAWRYAGDVAAAAAFARRRGATKTVAVGASMGGTAVLVAGANVRPPLAGVVSLSGGSDSSTLATVRRLTVPALFVAGELDAGGGFASAAQELHDATASPDKTIRIFPVSSHGVSLVRSNAEARSLTETFIRSHSQ